MFVSIRHKLALLLFLSVFVLTLLIVAPLQYRAYFELKRAQTQISQANIRAAMEAADKWMLSKIDIARQGAGLFKGIAFSSPELKVNIKIFAAQHRLATGIYAGLKSGEYIDSSDWQPPSDYVFEARPWYKKVMAQKTAVFVEAYKDAMTGKDVVTFAAPILKSTPGVISGVAAFDIFLDELKEVIGNIFMASVEELISFRLPDGRLGMLIRTNELNPRCAVLLAARIAEKGPEGKNIRNIDGKRFIVTYEWLSTNDSVMVYALPLHKIIRPILVQSLIYFVLTLVGLIVILAVSWYILRNHIKQIEDLSRGAKRIARGSFDLRLEKRSEDEIGQLADSFNKMGEDLQEYIEKLKETTAAKERMESELRIAHDIQMGLVPKVFPPFPEIREFDIYAVLKPAKEVGGDLYDFFFVDAKHLCFVIGDVSGKGVPAALFMAVAKTSIEITAWEIKNPAEILDLLNKRILNDNDAAMFVTVFCGILNIETGQVTYVNAGHNPPLIISSAGVVKFLKGKGGLPAGVSETAVYEKEKFTLQPGDTIYLYSDGVTEAFNKDDEQFSEERLAKEVRLRAADSLRGLVEGVLSKVSAFSEGVPQSDDITILALKYFGKDSAAEN